MHHHASLLRYRRLNQGFLHARQTLLPTKLPCSPRRKLWHKTSLVQRPPALPESLPESESHTQFSMHTRMSLFKSSTIRTETRSTGGSSAFVEEQGSVQVHRSRWAGKENIPVLVLALLTCLNISVPYHLANRLREAL